MSLTYQILCLNKKTNKGPDKYLRYAALCSSGKGYMGIAPGTGNFYPQLSQKESLWLAGKRAHFWERDLLGAA